MRSTAPDVEAIIYAEVDLAKTFLARAALDTVGHYSRNDIFKLSFDPTPRQHIHVGPSAVKPGSQRLSRAELFAAVEDGETAVKEEEMETERKTV